MIKTKKKREESQYFLILNKLASQHYKDELTERTNERKNFNQT